MLVPPPPNHRPPGGSLNPDVTQKTIKQTICIPGWTAKIRPPTSFTNKLKLQQIKERGLPGQPHEYEEDHFIPLSLGGHPTDSANLWPQGIDRARMKDVLESFLHKAVCAGYLRLAEAQAAIRNPLNWGPK